MNISNSESKTEKGGGRPEQTPMQKDKPYYNKEKK